MAGHRGDITILKSAKALAALKGIDRPDEECLAERVTTDASESDAASIQRAYQLLYGRSPDSAETAAALTFLRKPSSGETTRWQQYAQALLMANEMLYVD